MKTAYNTKLYLFLVKKMLPKKEKWTFGPYLFKHGVIKFLSIKVYHAIFYSLDCFRISYAIYN